METTKLISPAEIQAFCEARGEFGNIHIGGLSIPHGFFGRNVLITGECGTGKTTAIKSMIKQVRCRFYNAVIYDPKGDFTKQYFTEGDIAFDKFINLQEWLNNGTGFLFVTDAVQVAEVAKQLLSLPSKNNREVWFFFDEFDQLPAIPAVFDLLHTRSEGTQIVLSIQNSDVLTNIYNQGVTQRVRAMLIIEYCINIVFRVDNEDAKYFSDLFGSVVIDDKRWWKPVFLKHEHKLVLPSEIGTQENLSFYAKLGDFVTKSKL